MISSPYNLETNSKNKTAFYDQLALFTDEVIEYGRFNFDDLLKEYEAFILDRQLKDFQHDEYLMELLMIGTFYKNYQKYLSPASVFYQPVFNGLYKLRKQMPKFKPTVDAVRGMLATHILLKERKRIIPKNRELKYLINWLNNTKEFDQEVDRLTLWNDFLIQKNESVQAQILSEIREFSQWFEYQAEIQLGAFTKNWQNFYDEFSANNKNREDRIFCSRKPVEYHLNMVAAEVMNRALKSGFNQTKKKILLVPTCMRKSESCQAKLVNNNLTCQHCQSDCSVSHLTQTMNKKEVTTVMIPHSSGFSTYLKPWKDSKDTALIGVACVLNLVTGGYEMQKLNIPSQCVFLDRCGCKKHWLSGQPTQLNINQLNRLIDNDFERTRKHTAYSTC